MPARNAQTDRGERDTRDRALFARMQAGDDTALRTLFEAHYAGLVHYATRYVENHDQARDLVQDIFIDLWRRRDTLSVETSVATYLYAATRRATLAVRRHDRVVARWEGEASAITRITPRVSHNEGEGLAEADELGEIVQRIIAEMPPRMREIFLLSREQGLSHREIAEMLGVSVKTVAEQILRALQLLRGAIAEWE